MLEDTVLRERCIANALEMVHGQMSLKAVIGRLERYYLDLIRKGGRTPTPKKA